MIIKFINETGEYGWLSNSSPHGFYDYLDYYKTAEHYYQSQKFYRKDTRKLEYIMSLETPARARGFTRNSPYVSPYFAGRKIKVMEMALAYKFYGNPDLLSKLIDTGDVKIEHNSPTDDFWGTGPNGDGQNQLGNMLMDLRAEIVKKLETTGNCYQCWNSVCKNGGDCFSISLTMPGVFYHCQTARKNVNDCIACDRHKICELPMERRWRCRESYVRNGERIKQMDTENLLVTLNAEGGLSGECPFETQDAAKIAKSIANYEWWDMTHGAPEDEEFMNFAASPEFMQRAEQIIARHIEKYGAPDSLMRNSDLSRCAGCPEYCRLYEPRYTQEALIRGVAGKVYS